MAHLAAPDSDVAPVVRLPESEGRVCCAVPRLDDDLSRVARSVDGVVGGFRGTRAFEHEVGVGLERRVESPGCDRPIRAERLGERRAVAFVRHCLGTPPFYLEIVLRLALIVQFARGRGRDAPADGD